MKRTISIARRLSRIERKLDFLLSLQSKDTSIAHLSVAANEMLRLVREERKTAEKNGLQG